MKGMNDMERKCSILLNLMLNVHVMYIIHVYVYHVKRTIKQFLGVKNMHINVLFLIQFHGLLRYDKTDGPSIFPNELSFVYLQMSLIF